MERLQRLITEARLHLAEAEAPPLKQGQLKVGTDFPFGDADSDMIFRVVDVNPKRATLKRVSRSNVDLGPKLMGKGETLILSWDGIGYGKNKYKGKYQKQQGDPKFYVRPDGVY